MGRSDYHTADALIESLADEKYVEHYGIPGMKWGVRRSQETLDRLAGRVSSAKKTASKRRSERKSDRETVRKARRKARVDVAKERERGKVRVEKAKADKKIKDIESGSSKQTSSERTPTSKLTDKQLQERVNRLNLEKQYASLTKPPRTTSDRVRDFALQQGQKIVTQAADKMVQKAVSSIIDAPATNKGSKALAKTMSSASSSSGSSAQEIVNQINKTVPVPKSAPSKKTRSVIRKNQSKSVRDILDDYRYVGKRRLRKDRKVTN